MAENGQLTDVAQTWASGLAGFNGQAIANGLRSCVANGGDWPPALPAFRKMCTTPPADLQVPDAKRALAIAFRGKAHTGMGTALEKQWLHPIVYWAVRESIERGLIIWADMQQASAKQAIKVWEPIYQSFLARMAQGEVFEFPEMETIEDQSAKPLTPQEKAVAEENRQANLKEIRKLLK